MVVEALKARSDFWIDGVDLFFPYDGFTIITLNWIENVGYCRPGEAGPFLEQHWGAATNRVLVDGRMPINPHGGALSEGGTQGPATCAKPSTSSKACGRARSTAHARLCSRRRVLLQRPGTDVARRVTSRADNKGVMRVQDKVVVITGAGHGLEQSARLLDQRAPRWSPPTSSTPT